MTPKKTAKAQQKKNLYMMTLGCPKNRVDPEVMLGTLVQRGYQLVQEPSEAEVIVVNTCAFIGPAKQESVDNILELAEYKKEGRCETLVVTVDRRGTLYLDDREIDASELRRKVTAILRLRPQTPLLVRGDREVKYDAVVQAMVLLQAAGAPSVGLVTEGPAAKK